MKRASECSSMLLQDCTRVYYFKKRTYLLILFTSQRFANLLKNPRASELPFLKSPRGTSNSVRVPSKRSREVSTYLADFLKNREKVLHEDLRISAEHWGTFSKRTSSRPIGYRNKEITRTTAVAIARSPRRSPRSMDLDRETLLDAARPSGRRRQRWSSLFDRVARSESARSRHC